MKNIVITGGAGFIGSHVVRLFVNKYPEYKIICLDKLTYAGNLANLKDIEDKPNYKFVKISAISKPSTNSCRTKKWMVSFTWQRKAMWIEASRTPLLLHRPM